MAQCDAELCLLYRKCFEVYGIGTDKPPCANATEALNGEKSNICRDLSNTQEFKVLAKLLLDDLGHKLIDLKKSFFEQKKILIITGFRVSPTYKKMLSLFCPNVIAISIKAGEPMKMYGLPVIEDKEVSCIQFEFKDKMDEEEVQFEQLMQWLL